MVTSVTDLSSELGKADNLSTGKGKRSQDSLSDKALIELTPLFKA